MPELLLVLGRSWAPDPLVIEDEDPWIERRAVVGDLEPEVEKPLHHALDPWARDEGMAECLQASAGLTSSLLPRLLPMPMGDEGPAGQDPV